MGESGKHIEHPDIICWAFCSIADDSEMARDAIRPIIARILSDVPTRTLLRIGFSKEQLIKIKRQRDHIDKLNVEKLRPLVTNDLIDQFSIVGTPEDCLKRTEELINKSVSHITILPFENSEKGMDAKNWWRRFFTCLLLDGTRPPLVQSWVIMRSYELFYQRFLPITRTGESG